MPSRIVRSLCLISILSASLTAAYLATGPGDQALAAAGCDILESTLEAVAAD